MPHKFAIGDGVRFHHERTVSAAHGGASPGDDAICPSVDGEIQVTLPPNGSVLCRHEIASAS